MAETTKDIIKALEEIHSAVIDLTCIVVEADSATPRAFAPINAALAEASKAILRLRGVADATPPLDLSTAVEG